jgi:Tol biopolymer transport system component
MGLAPGTRLGAYEVLAPIGAGGMGEVYRARDTRLDRTVAIKVLPVALAESVELRERFDREARAISSLQHPNICSLFDVGNEASVRFLVLEFLEGETLAARVGRLGALPLKEALGIASEICSALDTAHRSNIIHRDLKPANVFLARSASGSGSPTAKLLDFGLAKPASPVVAAAGVSALPTTPATLTAQGTILGTFQYMAPEQIEGLEADARTDIFAFGAVLFEMLTGRLAFEGKTRATLLGAILKDDPPAVSGIAPSLPKAIDHVIARCVAKDPGDRWHCARDLLHELEWIASGEAAGSAAPVSMPGRTSRWKAWAAGAALAIVSIGIGVALARMWRPVILADVQFTIPSPQDTTFSPMPGGGTGIAPQIAVSPDGKNVVFVARRQGTVQLWMRPIGSVDAKPIDGTNGAAFPFWKPDSRSIAFFAGGKLKKVNVAGGPPQTLCNALSGRGGTWSRDDVIVFAPGTTGPLQRVSANGGSPTAASVLDAEYGESGHRFPWLLPDGRHFLFVGVVGTCCPARKDGRIRIGVLGSMEASTLYAAESMAVYASGHLLFNRGGTLMGQPFDPATRTLTGDPFAVAEGVVSEGSRYASFAANDSGVMVYARGGGRAASQLTWFDRSGTQLGTLGEQGYHLSLAWSSDERRVVTPIVSGAPPTRDLYIIDAATAAKKKLTFDNNAGNSAPLFSADDQRVVFGGVDQALRATLLQKPASGLGNEEVILDSPTGLIATDWVQDGRIIYTLGQGTEGTADIWVLPSAPDQKRVPYLTTSQFEFDAVLSPDGKWVAYTAGDNTMEAQVYVQSYPAGSGKFQISQGDGAKPLWRRDGKELFFLSRDGHMMAADIDSSDTFRYSPPVALFPVTTLLGTGPVGRQYAVSRDGKRFLVNVPERQSATTPLNVVLNWPALVQR